MHVQMSTLHIAAFAMHQVELHGAHATLMSAVSECDRPDRR